MLVELEIAAHLTRRNPFVEASANVHSTYAAWLDGRLVHPLDPECEPPLSLIDIHEKFRAHVLDHSFPCLGAKAAINGNTYRFGLYAEMNTEAATRSLAHDLWEFERERPAFQSDFTTFIASFNAPTVADEHAWEKLLWTQLQSLHELDKKHYAWDKSVSSDAADADFSFSFAGQGFFVVGMHPASSRQARRFTHPTLVFNLHRQFESLREQGQFERIRESIRDRDYKLQGSLNPNLTDFGEQSEARQYSGRAVEPDWRCPFLAGLHTTDDTQA